LGWPFGSFNKWLLMLVVDSFAKESCSLLH
jgi:hypothetical protein